MIEYHAITEQEEIIDRRIDGLRESTRDISCGSRPEGIIVTIGPDGFIYTGRVVADDFDRRYFGR